MVDRREGEHIVTPADRLADLCAAYRETCDTSDYYMPTISPMAAWYQAVARFRAAVNPDDVCAVIDQLGERP